MVWNGKQVPIDSDEREIFLEARRRRVRLLVENRHAIISEKHLHEALAVLRDITGIQFTLRQFEEILELYVFVRIQIAKYSVYSDKQCREELLNMVADFFLGSKWPEAGNREFISLLREQAAKTGYMVLTPASAEG